MPIKVGDVVQTKGNIRVYVVAIVKDAGIVGFNKSFINSDAAGLFFFPEHHLVVPEPPKAQPGALYQWGGSTLYVGLVDGRVRRVVTGNNERTGSSSCDWTYAFIPAQMTKVG